VTEPRVSFEVAVDATLKTRAAEKVRA